MSNTVTVNKNVTNVVTVTAQGPQGIQGPSGSQGAGFDSSSYTTTSSFNTFTGSYQTDSSSFNNKITSLISATSSYVLNSQTASFATTGSNTFNGNQIITGSLYTSGSINSQDVVYCEYIFTGSYNDGSSHQVNIPSSLSEHPNFTLNTGGIKVLSSGVYRISITLHAVTALTGAIEMAILINTNIIKTKVQQVVNRDHSVDITCIVSLLQDDVIYLNIYPTNTTTTNISSSGTQFATGDASWITVEKLN